MEHIEVVAAIILKNNRIFATRQGYGRWKDLWKFPGGKKEALHQNEHDAAKWLTKDELDSVQWLPADESIIEML